MFEGDWLTPEYKIDFGKSLGSGTFGIVYKGYSKSKDCFVAIKKLKGKAIREWNRPNSSIQQ
jgi:serine/threonine protein kinase